MTLGVSQLVDGSACFLDAVFPEPALRKVLSTCYVLAHECMDPSILDLGSGRGRANAYRCLVPFWLAGTYALPVTNHLHIFLSSGLHTGAGEGFWNQHFQIQIPLLAPGSFIRSHHSAIFTSSGIVSAQGEGAEIREACLEEGTSTARLTGQAEIGQAMRR